VKLKTDFLATLWQPKRITSRIHWRDDQHCLWLVSGLLTDQQKLAEAA
jgi:hypothetical protein